MLSQRTNNTTGTLSVPGTYKFDKHFKKLDFALQHTHKPINVDIIKENMASSLRTTIDTVNKYKPPSHTISATPNLDKLVDKYFPNERNCTKVPKQHAHTSTASTGTWVGAGEVDTHCSTPAEHITIYSSDSDSEDDAAEVHDQDFAAKLDSLFGYISD